MKTNIIITNKTKKKILLKNAKLLIRELAEKKLKKNLVFLSITFVGIKFIKKINTKIFNRKYATDVISLEMGSNKEIAGDIYICVEVANKNAKKFKVSLDEELKRLMIHGVLHSTGMEHKDGNKGCKMIGLQEKLVKEFEDLKIA